MSSLSYWLSQASTQKLALLCDSDSPFAPCPSITPPHTTTVALPFAPHGSLEAACLGPTSCPHCKALAPSLASVQQLLLLMEAPEKHLPTSFGILPGLLVQREGRGLASLGTPCPLPRDSLPVRGAGIV